MLNKIITFFLLLLFAFSCCNFAFVPEKVNIEKLNECLLKDAEHPCFIDVDQIMLWKAKILLYFRHQVDFDLFREQGSNTYFYSFGMKIIIRTLGALWQEQEKYLCSFFPFLHLINFSVSAFCPVSEARKYLMINASKNFFSQNYFRSHRCHIAKFITA